MREFAAFANEIAPQEYWRTFNTPANYSSFAESGFPVGLEGVTPEFLLNVSNTLLNVYGLPITHVGQGATPDLQEWRRFIDLAYGAGSTTVSAWRYGVMTPDIFELLRDTPPRVSLPQAPAAAVYIVQPGDTLGAIAGARGVGVETIMGANNLSDPNYIFVGQELQIPGGTPMGLAVSASPTATGGGGRGRTYTVEPGDTLDGIAGRFGTTAGTIGGVNNLANLNILSIGQKLIIP